MRYNNYNKVYNWVHYIPPLLQRGTWSWRQQRRGSRHRAVDRAQTRTQHSSGSICVAIVLKDWTSVCEGCLATTYLPDFNQTPFVDDWAHTTTPVAMDTNVQ